MNTRERVAAVLNYESYDQLPMVHFGFWSGTGDPATDTLAKWAAEGHLSKELAEAWADGNAADIEVNDRFSPELREQIERYPRIYERFFDTRVG